MLGHELRNPLAPIANAVSIMQLEPIESDRLRMCRDVISRQVVQMTRLVDDLLDVGRITAGKIHLELKPVELGARAGRGDRSHASPTRAAARTPSTLERPGAQAWVSGDRARLLQIVGNLLNNAVKFTDRGGRIAARAAAQRARSRKSSIDDNGPGIPHRGACRTSSTCSCRASRTWRARRADSASA